MICLGKVESEEGEDWAWCLARFEAVLARDKVEDSVSVDVSDGTGGSLLFLKL